MLNLKSLLTAKIAINTALCVLAAACVYFALITMIAGEQKRFSNRLLTQIDLLLENSKTTLDLLNRTTDATCEEFYLLYLRQMMFQSRYIKDIVYLDGDVIICSAGKGILDYEASISEHDFVIDNDYLVDAKSELSLFEFDYSAFRMTKGSFSTINELKEIITESDTSYRWKMRYITENNSFFMLGEDELSEEFQTVNFHINTVEMDVCNSSNTICVASSGKITDTLNFSNSLLLLSSWLILCSLMMLITARARQHISSIEYRIKAGLRMGYFFPVFQPIVCLDTNRIIGCEVLARFKDPQGFLYPDEFIPKIDSKGLTIEFTRKLMQRAVDELAGDPRLPKQFKVNINLFPSDLHKEKVQHFIDACKNTREMNICFEITEDKGIESKEAIEAISFIRENKISIAIDDFGTGYANLGQLQKFTFDYLKIDRSFVIAIAENNVKSTLIPSIIELAKKLDAKLVAEGVETQIQSDTLAGLGVELGQGWLYGKPMSAPEVIDLAVKSKPNAKKTASRKSVATALSE